MTLSGGFIRKPSGKLELVLGGIPTSLKNGVNVSWDDDIPKIWKNRFQTTNQLIYLSRIPANPLIRQNASGHATLIHVGSECVQNFDVTNFPGGQTKHTRLIPNGLNCMIHYSHKSY
jgi:hypothetical protein